MRGKCYVKMLKKVNYKSLSDFVLPLNQIFQNLSFNNLWSCYPKFLNFEFQGQNIFGNLQNGTVVLKNTKLCSRQLFKQYKNKLRLLFSLKHHSNRENWNFISMFRYFYINLKNLWWGKNCITNGTFTFQVFR